MSRGYDTREAPRQLSTRKSGSLVYLWNAFRRLPKRLITERAGGLQSDQSAPFLLHT